MKTIKDIEFLQGVKVFLRVDFNVPIKNGRVENDYRIRASLTTLNFLLDKGAKVIIASHLEGNDGGKPSLAPVAQHMKEGMKMAVEFVELKNAREFIENNMENGSCILLENLRLNDGEKSNDKNFAKELASLADIYVNEAFSVCHREHASVVGVPKYIDSYAGLELEKEVKYLSLAFDAPKPFLFVLAGSKFDTKLPLVEKFMKSADNIFIGGALANDLFKKKGYEIGKSKVSEKDFDATNILNSDKIILPVDVVVNENKENKDSTNVSKDDSILDVGTRSVESLKEKINSAKFILWNGTLGVYEKGYKESTLSLAKMISEATKNECQTIIGGGDTLTAIAELSIEDKFTFVSTGGGAMLDFLAEGTLPGIKVLQN